MLGGICQPGTHTAHHLQPGAVSLATTLHFMRDLRQDKSGWRETAERLPFYYSLAESSALSLEENLYLFLLPLAILCWHISILSSSFLFANVGQIG
jgi:hypothetical protein